MMFVRNAWYMAAWSDALLEKPVSITILSQPVVVFRGSDGVLGALEDVCPHRAVPLSLGTINGANIVCPYHGIEIDRLGVCRKNPHVKGSPDRLRARSYPVADKYGIVWVWMGSAEAADQSLIPDYTWFNLPEQFAVGRGYLHIEADYRLVIDNLMDLAHAAYIHADTVGQPGAAEVQQVTVKRDDTSISVNTVWPDLPPSALHRQAWTRTERVDKYLDMKWEPATNLLLDLGIMAPGDPREAGLHMPSAHILVPETERSTHYFWLFGRDFDRQNKDLTARIVETVGRAFETEDKPMIEAAQRNIERLGAPLRNFTKGDQGSALVRRELEKRAKVESVSLAAEGAID
ncbi:Rieske 2Fe-2S domain-containing protein [Sphingobium phenoxybenzoativorans]|uniref:Rieske 2Fe-2S domain-containing protein n=1 Tax=Sphingobium phenoxybenzoativorans TaxID=1592790 RepID=A0A975K697_9SPHN|nr:aromatic ring-hydroxylating dioxygenase subunit alpha [Sphingobium phenoxybenzoativorans]QUT05580.1 Rieske 2Fe-2S domain-containing protein [Sphingobium phenoxybenzoativorans]